MKFLAVAAAAFVATAAMTPVAADAAPRHGNHYRWKTVCKTTWRHGHRVRQCHKVRVRGWR